MLNTLKMLEEIEGDKQAFAETPQLEERIRQAVQIFYVINFIDESWSNQVQSGKSKYDPDIVRRISSLYKWWVSQAEVVFFGLSSVDRHKSDIEITGADSFRQCRRLAYKFSQLDIEALIESAQQAERGEFVEISDAKGMK